MSGGFQKSTMFIRNNATFIWIRNILNIYVVISTIINETISLGKDLCFCKDENFTVQKFDEQCRSLLYISHEERLILRSDLHFDSYDSQFAARKPRAVHDLSTASPGQCSGVEIAT